MRLREETCDVAQSRRLRQCDQADAEQGEKNDCVGPGSMCKSISRIPEVICADLKIEHTNLRVCVELHFVVGPPVEALFSKDRSVGFVYGIVGQNGIWDDGVVYSLDLNALVWIYVQGAAIRRNMPVLYDFLVFLSTWRAM